MQFCSEVTTPATSTTALVQCWSIMNSMQCVGQCNWNIEFQFCEGESDEGLPLFVTSGVRVVLRLAVHAQRE
jgi:hypothetical protein